MKKKKKKGFTLVEMLAAIVIISILAFLIVPKISQLINKGKEAYYSALEKEIKVLAQDYYASNRKELPLNTNEYKILTASTMIKNGYIKEMFKDAESVACNNSFAVVANESNNNYDYISCLICDNYESSTERCQELKTEAGYINKIKQKHQVLTAITDEEINTLKDKIIAQTGVTRNDITLDLNYVDVNTLSGTGQYKFIYNVAPKGIYGYEGLIQVIDEIAPTIEGEFIYSEKGTTVDILSGLTITDNYYAESEITVNIAEIDTININTPGSYTVRVTATDPSGNETHKDIEVVIFDKIVTFSPNNSNWTNANVNVGMSLETLAGLTVSSWSYRIGTISSGSTSWEDLVVGVGTSMTQNLTTTGIKVIEVAVTYDNNETYVQTSGQYKIDKETPTCGSVTGQSTTWTKNNRLISVGCSAFSGCTQASYSNTFSSTTQVGTITISNNAGTSISCNVNAYVDKTLPECGNIVTSPVNASSSNWTNGQRQVTVSCSDEDSQCSSTTFTDTYTSDLTTSTITISDNASNTTTCNVPVYVDNVKPNCSLQVTTSGVSFLSKTDTNSLASYGMNKTGTAVYDSTSALVLETGTFYGYVQDVAGNTNSCSATLSSTTQKYTCYKSASTVYDNLACTSLNFSAAQSGSGCNSGYTYNSNTCTRDIATWVAMKRTCNMTANKWTKTTKTCTYNRSVCKCTGGSTFYSLANSGVCTRTCHSDATFTAAYYSETTATAANQTSCTPSTQYSSCSSTTSGNQNITCAITGWSGTWISSDHIQSSCTVGSAPVTCTLGTHDGRNYIYSCSAYTYNNYAGTIYCSKYACSSGSLSGSRCYLYGQSSCSSGWTSSLSSATCSSGTKLDDSYCYVIN